MPSFEAVPGQSFRSHVEWVCKASSWLTRHPQYRNTEHAKGKGWQAVNAARTMGWTDYVIERIEG